MTAPGTPSPEDITRTKATEAIRPGGSQVPTGDRSFSSYMEGGQPNPLTSTRPATQLSPFDLARGQVAAAGPTFDSIQAQAKSAHMSFGEMAEQFNTPKLKLKQSTKYILRNKLNAANAHIRSAGQKIGAKQIEPGETPAGASPVQRFLGMVTHGQNQLEEVQRQLSDLQKKGEHMSPADMLLLQVKLNKAQQELEYSSVLLSKAVDDIKMMMNVQL